MDLKANKAKTAYLILADGTVFTGKSFGCEGRGRDSFYNGNDRL